jgi:hypothetical protein
MNRASRAATEAQEEQLPRLQVVASKNGVGKARKPLAPLIMLSRLHQRPARPELAALGWSNRAVRLARGK